MVRQRGGNLCQWRFRLVEDTADGIHDGFAQAGDTAGSLIYDESARSEFGKSLYDAAKDPGTYAKMGVDVALGITGQRVDHRHFSTWNIG